MLKETLKCEFCGASHDDVELYEGWFYAVERDNWVAKGTATYGLMQRRIACKECGEKRGKNATN